MRVVRVSAAVKERIGPSTCRVCGRVVKVGQIVLHQHLNNAPWDLEDLWWHASCVSELVAKAPQDADPDRFVVERERIRRTGKVFV